MLGHQDEDNRQKSSEKDNPCWGDISIVAQTAQVNAGKHQWAWAGTHDSSGQHVCECLSWSTAPWRVQSCPAQACLTTGCQEKGNPYVCYVWFHLTVALWVPDCSMWCHCLPWSLLQNRWFNPDRSLKAITTAHSSSNLHTVVLSVEQLKAWALRQESKIQILASLFTWVKTMWGNALKRPTDVPLTWTF